MPSEAWLLDRNGEVLAVKRMDPKVRRLEWDLNREYVALGRAMYPLMQSGSVRVETDVPAVRVCFAIGLQNDGSDGAECEFNFGLVRMA